MASLEAASSLFGSEDSAADPFASLGSDAPSQQSSNHSTADDLFSNAQNQSPHDFPPFLSDSFPEEQSREQGTLADTTQGLSHELGSHSTTNSMQAVSYDNAYNSDWQNHSQPVVNGTSHSNTYASAYEPYAPSQYAPAQAQASSYAPYAPSSTAQTNNYTSNYSPYAPPPASTTTQPTYTPPQPTYAPQSQPTQYSAPPQPTYVPQSQPTHYGTTAYSAPSQPPLSAQTNFAAPPPTPKATLNRPKVLNAYDPPFPTTTSRRRPTPSSSAYNTYNSASSPLPPPPLRPPSNASYGSEQLPPPPPRPASNASYSSHSAAPRPPSSASYSQSPPPRPSSNASYSSHSYRPPSRPPSSSPYSPQTFQSSAASGALGSASSYSPNTVYEHPRSSTHPPAHSSPRIEKQPNAIVGQNEYVYGSGTEIPATVTSANNSSFDPEGGSTFTGHEETGYSNAESWTPHSMLNNTNDSSQLQHSPEDGFVNSATLSPSGNDVLSNTEVVDSDHADTNPDVFSNPARTSSPAMLHESSEDNTGMVSYDHSSPTSIKSFGQPSEIAHTHLPESSPIPAASDPYKPSVNTQSLTPANSIPADPYAPQTSPEQTSSPSSVTSYGSNPYLPQRQPTRPPPRSMSISSLNSTKSEDPYAPSLHNRLQSHDSDHGPYSTFTPISNDVYTTNGPSSGLGPPQDIYMKAAPTHTPYAPSPSLLGTNDPLGRASARIPVFSFGFGGKVVTCFHGADKLNTGFDVALASKNSTGIQIQILNKIIPESALSVSAASFPGPLFSDPGTPTTSLVRPGVSSQAKTKKARVLKYLEERATEISQGLHYLHSGSSEQRQAEGKLVLVKLLKIMVENDGKITGSPNIESAVRAALIPRLDASLSESDSSSLTVPGFTPADLQGSTVDGGLTDPADVPVTTYSIRPSVIEKVQDFLLRGQRRQAYHYALDQKLWAHAMVIASGIDKEAWQEAVNEFLKTELGSVQIGSTSSKEGLRVAYSLFSGQGAVAVQQLIPQNSLSDPGSRVPPIGTPMTPNFATALSTKIPAESLSQWAETVGMILSGTMSLETSNAITALGDHLAANSWIEAAHACYLLAPQTSPVAGFAHQSARIALLGSGNPQATHNFTSDPDPIILSEILEFALSLTPTVKGQEPFGGLAHLQPYRFIRAMHLAEVGDISLANRYCEAITASLSRPSPYFSNALLEQIRGLSDRIIGVTHVDKTGSWMGSKIGKPSLDSIGGWLEGRFTKLVTGDLDSPGPKEEQSKTEERGFVGPFSQYSTISSTTTSTSPSPQSSVTNLNVYAPPPPRSGSSMSNRSSLSVAAPLDRASSAMDYSRPKPLPGPRVASASAATTTFAQSQSFGQAVSHYSPYSAMANGDSPELLTPRPGLESTEEEGQEATWWGSSAAATPTATSFVRLNEASTPVSSDGFISLMDNANFSVGSSSHTSRRQTMEDDVDEEDLGFGNTKPRSKVTDDNGANDDAKATKPEAATTVKAPVRPDIKPTENPAGSGSWLSRWWKKDSAPGPVKASLGEEVSFYYDKDLKRWVNKKAGDDAAPTATPPPPPPRAQTASPAGSRPMAPSAGARPPSTGPPPARSASSADIVSGKPPMRIRSNLVPDSEVGSAPSTPTGSRLAAPTPPPGRPRSQASKRNIRNRYVDVFQQEGSA